MWIRLPDGLTVEMLHTPEMIDKHKVKVMRGDRAGAAMLAYVRIAFAAYSVSELVEVCPERCCLASLEAKRSVWVRKFS